MEVLLGLAAVPLSKARPYLRTWDKHGIGVEVVQRFLAKQKGANKRGYRLYIPIDGDAVERVRVPTPIEAAVLAAGYVVEDYVLGIASKDGGTRKIKIGKLISKNAHLKELFDNDKQRASRKDEYVCVISAHPYDIIGMSTGRRWDQTSCMRIGLEKDKDNDGAFVGTLKHDITEGTLVAYAISPNDENIEKPHSRFLIRPFKNLAGDGVVFVVARSAYGNEVPGFKTTVEKWLKKVNAGAKQGFYRMPAELYDDGQDRNHLQSAKPSQFRRQEDLDKFLKEAVTNVEDADKALLTVSKDWLEPLLNYHNSTENFQKYWACLETAKAAGFKGKFIAKMIDYTMGGTIIQQVVSSILFSHHSKFYIKDSYRIKRWLEENVEYAEGKPAPPSSLLSIAVLSDARWTAVIPPTGKFVENVFQMIINGRGLPVPKELPKMKAGMAGPLNTLIGIVVQIGNIIGEPGSVALRNQMNELSLLKYKDDLSFTEEKRDLLFDCRGYVWLIAHYSKSSVLGVLGAADARWIEQIPLRFAEFDDITILKIWDRVMESDSDALKKILAEWSLSMFSWRSYITKPGVPKNIGVSRFEALLAWMQTNADMKFDVPNFMRGFDDFKKFMAG